MNIIKQLEDLEKNWDKSLMLFGGYDALLLVNINTKEVLATFAIPNDGGDPGTLIVDGKEYLDMG